MVELLDYVLIWELMRITTVNREPIRDILVGDKATEDGMPKLCKWLEAGRLSGPG